MDNLDFNLAEALGLGLHIYLGNQLGPTEGFEDCLAVSQVHMPRLSNTSMHACAVSIIRVRVRACADGHASPLKARM